MLFRPPGARGVSWMYLAREVLSRERMQPFCGGEPVAQVDPPL
jgi:hypothetical protein